MISKDKGRCDLSTVVYLPPYYLSGGGYHDNIITSLIGGIIRRAGGGEKARASKHPHSNRHNPIPVLIIALHFSKFSV